MHSRAYQVLFDQRSADIVRSLAGDGNPHEPAYKDERCLACHTTPRPQAALAATSWMNPDGVGCESCHGASGRWLGLHTTTGWELKDRQAKAALGLANTKDLAVRAAVCAGCHVGRSSSDGLLKRDVNHDLIAAGHPRLNFELAAFLDNLPPHWEEKDENADPKEPTKRAANFPARAWAIGQLATELASLQLLHARVADAAAPWPEFTEYGCFSCHHDLRDEAWRRAARSDKSTVGTPRRGSWTRPLTDVVIKQFIAGAATQPYTESLDRLAQAMAQPVPDKGVVRREARAATESLGTCLNQLAGSRFGPGEVQRLIERLNHPQAWEKVASWDQAAQHYLALVALRQAWVGLEPARKADQDRLKTWLDDIYRKLTFPSGLDSPRGFDPSQFPVGR
jgi:hypothetical protein